MEVFDQGVDLKPAVASAISHDAVLTARVRIAAWSLLTLIGLIETISSRHAMQDDGISYLDMGDAIVRGDWKMAFNGIWSPLYPLLQGGAHRLLKPNAYWQFAVVHGVNFLIYLFALACFDFLLRATVASRSGVSDGYGRSGPLPSWSVFAIGYAVFLWSSLSLISLQLVSPDILMAGFLYLAMGLLLKIWAQPHNFQFYVLLGAALGLGYLAKAPIFPLAFLFLLIVGVVVGDWRTAVPGALAIVLVFLAVSAPWFIGLSRTKGRITFGDSAKFNYVLHVNDAAPNGFFQNLGTAGGHFTHPVRKIFDAPPIYEFATPLKGTLPVWYDPSYWAEGAVPRVHPKAQLSVIHHWLRYYLDNFFTAQTPLFVGFVVLCFMSGRTLFLKEIAARWPVWLIGLAGMGMYALVHSELRYVAVFFTLFWVGLFSGLQMPPGRDGRRLVLSVTIAVVIAIAGPTLITTGDHFSQALSKQPHNHWQVAEDLHRLGVNPGDKVARFPAHYGLAWARLLGVTVVAQVPVANSMDFWYAKPEIQAQIVEVLRRLGVTAIVAEQVPPDEEHAPGPAWHKLGDGRYYALILAPENAN